MKTTDVTGIILAGGQGRRMGYKDKGWVTLNGIPLINHTLKRLKPQVDKLIISANRNIDDYKALGVPVVTDSCSDFQGPIAGILATLEKVETKYAVIVPVDAPFLPTNLVETLTDALITDSEQLILIDDGERIHPLFGLYPVSFYHELKHYFESGERRLMAWCKQQPTTVTTMDGQANLFCNINDAQSLALIEKKP